MGVSVLGSSQVLLNALYVRADANQLDGLLKLDGVDRISRMVPLKLHMNKALGLMNVPNAWTTIGGSNNAGTGVKIAIIDTGIDQDHPAFKGFTSSPPPGYPKCRTDNSDCSYTNNKIIAARSYIDMLNREFGSDPLFRTGA